MKMGFFSAGFWGVFLIVLGLALIIKYVMNIDFPVFRVMVALLLIYTGVVLIFGRSHFSRSDNRVLFGESRIPYSQGQKKYECVFGKATLDLRGLNPVEDEMIEVSCTFGEYVILLSPGLNYEILSSSAFGSFVMPDKSSFSFGSHKQRSEHYDSSRPIVTIKGSVAFGNIEFKVKE